MPFPLLLDEMLRDSALWTAVQVQGDALDIVRVGDDGIEDAPALGAEDPVVLQWAIAHDRTIVTQDVGTMIGYHDDVVSSGADTPGLLVLRRGFSIPTIVESLLLASNCLERYELTSQTVWIPFS